ncbi:hypothetical protein Pint_33553 [Pistacia integerrima]|uniref:Uncharacterized protein n=1 Tax=Pistacia integerrima TaxID=434235 RepID=A0ACC0X9B3_9ROSI|nr:hypothetical protein Pint_33553 [Pistacia integerrima]
MKSTQKANQEGGIGNILSRFFKLKNYQNYPPDEPNYVNIESPPSMHPCKRLCDMTGYENLYCSFTILHRTSSAHVFNNSACSALLTLIYPHIWLETLWHLTTIQGLIRYANAEVFKLVRSLPSEYVQRYLALRNAAVVLK